MPSFRVIAVQDENGRFRAELYRPAEASKPLSVSKQTFLSPQVAVSALLAALEPHFSDPLLAPSGEP